MSFLKAYLISFNSRQIARAKFTVCCPSSFISLKHNGLFEIKNHQFNRRDTVPFEINARSLLYKICIGEEFQMFTYTRHSWPLNRKSSLACRTFCDKGHTLIWSFQKNAVELPLRLRRLRSKSTGERTPTSCKQSERSTNFSTAEVSDTRATQIKTMKD